MDNITENMYKAAIKATDIMSEKYNNTWFTETIVEGEVKVDIKPEYVKEYDDLYNKFLNI